MQKEINDHRIKIKLIDGTQITAQINLNRDPGYDRLSDIVAGNKEPFLILSNTISYYAKAIEPIENTTLFVNKDHIIWAVPLDD